MLFALIISDLFGKLTQKEKRKGRVLAPNRV